MVTLNEFAAVLAECTGCNNLEAESFLRELLSLTSERLESDGTVEVPSLGTFSVVEGKIVFQPDKELAGAVNMPFADFKPIEVPEGFSVDEKHEDAGAKEEIAEDNADSNVNVSEEPEPPVYSVPSETIENPEEPVQSDVTDNLSEDISVKSRPAKRIGCCWALLIGLICLCIGFIVGWFISQYYTPISSSLTEEAVEAVELNEITDLTDTSVVINDSIQEAMQYQAYTPVLDTIRVGYFLTTMARKHYNQTEYWVYIYEANAQNIGNPELLEAGTVIVVPPADSLGLVPGNEAKLAEAELKSKQILDRFN